MLQSIQLCRAVAALLVVFFHSAGNLDKPRYFGSSADLLERTLWFGGDAGVAFFFVLSGFIIHYSHADDFDRPERLQAYLRKRAVRIYPTYLIVFVAVFVMALLLPVFKESMPTDPVVILKSLLLLPQDSQVVGGTGSPVLVVAWSLQYEIMFYAAFGVALVNRHLFYVVASLLALTVLTQPFFGPYPFPGSFFGNNLMLLFGMGMVASFGVRSGLKSNHEAWLSAISVIAFAATAVVATLHRGTFQKPPYNLAYGLTSAVLIFSLARIERRPNIKIDPKLFGALGDASYSLYLIHFPLVSVLTKIAAERLPVGERGAFAAFVILVGGSVCASLAFNLAIERPLLRLLGSGLSLQRPSAIRI